MSDLETTLRSALEDAANAVAPHADAWATYRGRGSRHDAGKRVRLTLSVAGAALATAAIATSVVVWAGGNDQKSPPKRGGLQRTTLFPSGPALNTKKLQEAASILKTRLHSTGVDNVRITVERGVIAAIGTVASIAALDATASVSGSFQIRRVLAMGPGRGVLPHQEPSVIGKAPTLTPTLLQKFRHWNCAGRHWPTLGRPRTASDYIVGCSTDGKTRYLLGPAVMSNHDIASAHARAEPAPRPWLVELDFTPNGATAWRNLTATAASDPKPMNRTCSRATGCNSIALVLDGAVLDAPVFNEPIRNAARFTLAEGFSPARARELAGVLDAGRLPAQFLPPALP